MQKMFEFVLISLEPFVTISQWIQLRDTNKSIRTLCTRVQTRQNEENRMLLLKWIDVMVRPNCIRLESYAPELHVEFPENQHCEMAFMRWNYNMECGPLNMLKNTNDFNDYVAFLELGSYYHSTSSHKFLDFSPGTCLVQIGNIPMVCFKETISVEKWSPSHTGQYHTEQYTNITFQLKALRVSLSIAMSQKCVIPSKGHDT